MLGGPSDFDLLWHLTGANDTAFPPKQLSGIPVGFWWFLVVLLFLVVFVFVFVDLYINCICQTLVADRPGRLTGHGQEGQSEPAQAHQPEL